MSVTEILARVRRYDENANVIFDEAEPIGRATDLVMPSRPWLQKPAARFRAAFSRRAGNKISPPLKYAAAPKDS
jgi:hypothetical protein